MSIRAASSIERRSLCIALFSPAIPEIGGNSGVVTYVRIMRDALRSLGHSVIVATGDNIEHVDGNVVAVPQPYGLTQRLKILQESLRPDDGSDPWVRLRVFAAYEAARRAGAQVMEIEEGFGWARRFARRGVPIVERLHGPHVYGRGPVETPEEKRRGDKREDAELSSFREVHAITCPSQRLLNSIIARYELHLPIAQAIPNPMPVAPPSARWNVERGDANQILCVGRFDLRKGADLVIGAFALAAQSNPSLKLVMVGPDTGLARTDGSVIHFDEFVGKVVPLELRARIRFLGSQPHERIAELQLESGFAMVGSRFENFPYSIAEAMAAGMPVLASDSFGNGEMIRDGVDGRVVPVGDTAAMVEAMLALAGNRGELAKMGDSAYTRVVQWLSPERIALETVAVYREAMRGRKSLRRGNPG